MDNSTLKPSADEIRKQYANGILVASYKAYELGRNMARFNEPFVTPFESEFLTQIWEAGFIREARLLVHIRVINKTKYKRKKVEWHKVGF